MGREQVGASYCTGKRSAFSTPVVCSGVRFPMRLGPNLHFNRRSAAVFHRQVSPNTSLERTRGQ